MAKSENVAVLERKEGESVKQEYNELMSYRNQRTEMAKACAELTVPALFPPLNVAKDYIFPKPYQSIGSRGVNNLAAKLMLTLFPPTQTLFRLEIPSETLDKLGVQSRGEVEKGFRRVEKAVSLQIQTSGAISSLYEGIKQILVAGNVLFHVMPERGIKVIRLSNFVVKRDTEGNILKIITMEKIDFRTLDIEIQNYVRSNQAKGVVEDEESDEREVELYTDIERVSIDKWKVYQEVDGVILDTKKSSTGYYSNDELPFIVGIYALTHGEDYARSFVEEVIGDLLSLEGLSRVILEGSQALARMLFLVNPGSTLDPSEVERAENLACLSGKDGDIVPVHINKAADLQVSAQTAQELKNNLAQAFLLSSVRSAERVEKIMLPSLN